MLAACNYTPAERTEKVVKEYCKAIQKKDGDKMSALTYEKPQVDYAEVVDETTTTLPQSDLKFNIKVQCAINDSIEFTITSVKNIYSTLDATDMEDVEAVACDSVPATGVEAVEAYDEYSHQHQSEISKQSWPSDVQAAYEVEVKSGTATIIFTVVQLGEKDFKIYSTKGLYTYDLSDITKKLECTVTLPDDVDDEDKKENVSTLIDNLRTFDIFSKAILANDTTVITRLFPAIKNYDYHFKGKPSAKQYTQVGDNYVIITPDSLRFKFSETGMIIDSYGIISFEKQEASVKALDGTPRKQGDKFDIEHIKSLESQAVSLEREKLRKAKAAKYKTQGVALINSHFTSNGKGAKGVEFSALNTSSKTAKYVIMEVVGYNSVDDPVWSNGYLKRCRGIGPIAPGEGGQWDFNDIWENGNIVSDYQIKTLIIQFSDGTSKSIKLPQPLPSDWRNWLY